MKNNLFLGMIVCVAMAIGLILAGCDTGTGDDDPGIENTDGNGNNTGGDNTGGDNTGGNGDNTGNGGNNTGGTGNDSGGSAVDPSNGTSVALTSGTWKGGVVASFDDIRWYKYSSSETTYLWWHADQTNSYNGQIRVTAYKSDGTTKIFDTSTEAWSSAKTVTDTGTIYLKVERSGGSWGATYGIVYSTSSSKPTLSSSSLSRPENVTAAHVDYEARRNTSRNSIKITWSPVPGAVSYDVYEWETALGGYWNYVAMNVTGTEYTHTGLEPATSHSYMVRAVGIGGYEGNNSTTGGNAMGMTAR